MSDSLVTALTILSRFWLEEVTVADLELIGALPELAQALPNTDPATLTELAVEYQRLFAFNLFPHESVFIDPAAMLMAPATERVQQLYRQAAWTPPAQLRAGAPDHVGIELLALAEWLAAGRFEPARHLHSRHLALWLPPFVLTLNRLEPLPFYGTLGELTLALILETLPSEEMIAGTELFPPLPGPPVYRGSDDLPALAERMSGPSPDDKDDIAVEVRDFVKHLLTPREAGLFLTRQDIARISHALNLPQTIGERFRMLEDLFRAAGQYDLWPDLRGRLEQLVANAEADYRRLGDEYPAWRPYGQAWGERLARTRARLEGLDIA
jgi:TorA maturation chaperone TorD